MGSSREIAIGPVAVVSLLLSAMISKVVDPAVDPAEYLRIVFTVTFFTGTFQALFGFFRFCVTNNLKVSSRDIKLRLC